MAFENQFSLSLELTKLIPLSLQVAGKSYEAAMRLARELQNSGSDIVVEEELALIFGRSRIERGTESSFKSVVSQSSGMTTWANGIGLICGPGPTVVRAFTDQHYFSTIIQCSLLVSIHECGSLANAIVTYLEKIAEDAPEQSSRHPPPSLGSVQGMLQACEDQTAGYNWRGHLLAIAMTLGVEEDTIYETIPTTVLHGLLSMLPLAQTFPEERYITIETPQGVCSIVAWAYVLLGMPVLVRFFENEKWREVRFQPDRSMNRECIVVEVYANYMGAIGTYGISNLEPEIVLLSTSTNEKLFSLKAQPDEDIIDATCTAPAKGIASRILYKAMYYVRSTDRLVKEMMPIACSFAFCMAKRLQKGLSRQEFAFADEALQDPAVSLDNATNSKEMAVPMSYYIDPECILAAARFLFDVNETQLERQLVEDYALTFTGQSFSKDLVGPRSVQNILRSSGNHPANAWPQLELAAKQVSLLILAFAHVTDIEACDEMQVIENNSYIAQSKLSLVTSQWDGSSYIIITDDMWMELISLMLTGSNGMSLSVISRPLISKRGWSVFVNTFGDADPTYIEPGKVTIRRGTPWRNGVWRHSVLDGSHRPIELDNSQKAASFGNTVSLSCPTRVAAGKPIIGDRQNSLVLIPRLYAHTAEAVRNNRDQCLPQTPFVDVTIRRTGYFELWQAIWMSTKTRPCAHPAKLGEKLKLDPGWCALQDFGDPRCVENLGDLRICLTAGSTPARWWTLLSIWEFTDLDTRVMIRGSDCCFECAVAQTAVLQGVWYLIL